MSNLTVQGALDLLKEYSCVQVKNVSSAEAREKLRQALLMITNLCTYETIGVCADNPEQGLQALSSYLNAFGYQVDLPTPESREKPGPVYIKFNTEKMSCYLDSYTGFYRGVLIACQGGDDNIIGTYGHFPLDLFSESVSHVN